MISIIIPVYNGAEWLAEAIESALQQRWKPFAESIFDAYLPEIIVIDDGSTDNSLEIAKKYQRVKVISQVNKGLASARNTGIMNAQGRYCLMLDADDVLLPNALQRITEVIKQNPDTDIIAPSFREFGLGNREVILMDNPTIEDFKKGNRLGYCAAIKRSALLEVGGYSPKMVEGYEDIHLWVNLLTRGKKIITIPEVLWMYRIKSQSMYTKAIQYHKKLLAQINKDFKIGMEF